MELTNFKLAIIAISAISLTACTSDMEMNDLVIEESNAISFNIQTPNLTRASDSYNMNSRPTRFKVTAYQGATNYYGGAIDEMSSTDGGYTWTSNQTRFWPVSKLTSENSLTFYAFIEHNDMDACTAAGSPHSFDMTGDVPMFRNFKVNSDVTRQNDLMYAVAKDVNRTSTRQGNVMLNFRHALSQICFTAQNNDPTLDDIEIISIEVGGVKGTGTYRFPQMTTNTLPINSTSRQTDSMGEWIIDNTAANETYKLANLSERLGTPDASGHGKVRNVSNPGFTNGQGESESIDISKAMYLIPQKVKACKSESEDDGAYFKVTVKMTSKYSEEEIEPETIFVPVSVDWKEGQRYVYNLKWEGTLISYNVNIADYVEVNY